MKNKNIILQNHFSTIFDEDFMWIYFIYGKDNKQKSQYIDSLYKTKSSSLNGHTNFVQINTDNFNDSVSSWISNVANIIEERKGKNKLVKFCKNIANWDKNKTPFYKFVSWVKRFWNVLLLVTVESLLFLLPILLPEISSKGWNNNGVKEILLILLLIFSISSIIMILFICYRYRKDKNKYINKIFKELDLIQKKETDNFSNIYFLFDIKYTNLTSEELITLTHFIKKMSTFKSSITNKKNLMNFIFNIETQSLYDSELINNNMQIWLKDVEFISMFHHSNDNSDIQWIKSNLNEIRDNLLIHNQSSYFSSWSDTTTLFDDYELNKYSHIIASVCNDANQIIDFLYEVKTSSQTLSRLLDFIHFEKVFLILLLKVFFPEFYNEIEMSKNFDDYRFKVFDYFNQPISEWPNELKKIFLKNESFFREIDLINKLKSSNWNKTYSEINISNILFLLQKNEPQMLEIVKILTSEVVSNKDLLLFKKTNSILNQKKPKINNTFLYDEKNDNIDKSINKFFELINQDILVPMILTDLKNNPLISNFIFDPLIINPIKDYSNFQNHISENEDIINNLRLIVLWKLKNIKKNVEKFFSEKNTHNFSDRAEKVNIERIQLIFEANKLSKFYTIIKIFNGDGLKEIKIIDVIIDLLENKIQTTQHNENMITISNIQLLNIIKHNSGIMNYIDFKDLNKYMKYRGKND
ncbi:MAG: hypothetical protein ACRC4L_02255 [Mycoplasma sp.]